MFSNYRTTCTSRSNPSFRTVRGDSGPPRSPAIRRVTPDAELRPWLASLHQAIGTSPADATARPMTAVALLTQTLAALRRGQNLAAAPGGRDACPEVALHR
jgi:hypothetical protein